MTTTVTNPKLLEMENDRNRVHIANFIDYKLSFLKSNLGSKWVVIDNNEPVFLVLRVWLLLVWELQVTK